jgi:hypothetical protein
MGDDEYEERVREMRGRVNKGKKRGINKGM